MRFVLKPPPHRELHLALGIQLISLRTELAYLTSTSPENIQALKFRHDLPGTPLIKPQNTAVEKIVA